MLAAQLNEWTTGIHYELAFWSRWIAAKGGSYAQDFANRTNPAHPVDDFLERVIGRTHKPVVQLLDVGAGPLCCLGKVSRQADLRITAIDPLADFYAQMLAANDLVPPVHTGFGTGEDLLLQFQSGSFDIIHCQNALDHSLDPVRSVLQMLAVCRIGGFVMLRHAHNEAENERYQGFHKWNLTNEGEAILVWNRETRLNLSELVESFATTELLLTDGYLINLFAKTAELPANVFPHEGLRYCNFQRAVIRMLGETEANPPASRQG
jgi:SAM-dependent methyltransferase